MRILLVVLGIAIVISCAVAAESDWAVRLTEDLCLWAPESAVDGGSAEVIQAALDAVEDYWTPGPVPSDCVLPEDSPLSAYMSDCANVPLATVALYADLETMRRDLDRFDLRTLVIWYQPPPYGAFRPTAFLARLPDDATIRSGSLVFACRCSDEMWECSIVYGLACALQRRQWDLALPAPYDALLMAGVAEHTEYALGYRDRFDLGVAGPVSIWLAEGGRLGDAPQFLFREIGASLVDALVHRNTPAALWSVASGPCRSWSISWLLGRSTGFDAAFFETYGCAWEAFLDTWSSETAATIPAVGSQFVYRWLRDAYVLRATLLAPLLSSEQSDRIAAMTETLYTGAGSAAELDAVDAILRNACGIPTSEALEALREREATLIDYAREWAGVVSEVAEVLRLGILARRGDVPAEEYVRAFVDVVNEFIPMAVQQPIADRY